MTKPDLSGRTPTVQRVQPFSWPRWRVAPRSPAKPLARDPRTQAAPPATPAPAASVPSTPETLPRAETSRGRSTLLGWMLRESVALLGMAGAALTVLSQLAWAMPLSKPFIDVIGWWMTVTSDFWISNYDSLGFYPHAHVQAAIELAVFLAMIGLGARISGLIAGVSFDRRWSPFQGMTWPSLAIMGVLGIIFLLGHDPSASTATYDGAGGKEAVKYLFAVLLAAGYGVGDYLGQRGFHTRLYRLAILLTLLVALNLWLTSSH